MYYERHIEKVIKQAAETFAAVVVTGPRQVGKTTLLQHEFPSASYTTLDRIDVLEAALNDPEDFLSMQKEPAIIDEVQYAPDIFRYIKIVADTKRDQKGRYFLTGSQRYVMMQGVDESLAGRAGTVEMLGLSFRESSKDPFSAPFVPEKEYFKSRQNSKLAKRGQYNIWELIFKGDLPELYAFPKMAISLFYDSYIDTYLRRDVRDLAHVGDLTKFNRFLILAAHAHGGILNKSDLADKAGISFQTADRWLSVLEASNVIYLLRPFSVNTNKRLVKSPKLYFLNSGLAARLCGFKDPEHLERSMEAGAYFEGFILTEIIKSHLNATGAFPELYYYRDSNKNEIDLILVDGTDLYPIEIKKAKLARSGDIGAFRHLDSLKGYQRKTGALVCNCEDLFSLNKENWAVPVFYV